jgi:hypothetical protein
MRANVTTRGAMSLLDRVGKLEEQVAARLKELEPVVREYDQLRRVAQRLGLDYSAAASKPESEPIQASPASTGRRAAAKKRAASRSRGTASPRAARAKRAAKSRTTPVGARHAPRTAQRATAAASGAPNKPAAASQAAAPAEPGAARAKRAAKSPTAAGGTPRAAPAETDAAAPSKPATAPPAASHSTTPAKRSSARNRAATGRRFDDVLRVVSANPGITLREIGQHLGMDAAWLYRVAKRLTNEGRLRRDNTRLYPVEPGGAAGPNRG